MKRRFYLLIATFVLFLISGCEDKSESRDIFSQSDVDLRDVVIFDIHNEDISYMDISDTDGLYIKDAEYVAEIEDTYFSDIDIKDADREDILDAILDIDANYELTFESIGFEDGIYPPESSIIFFNSWSLESGKDTVEMISPDGSYKAVRFSANRVWSFGVSSDGRTIAFSSADPYQFERYGINVYDAIQYTWLLKEGEKPIQITNGPINDECHNFINNNSELMMCRRANFKPDDKYMVVYDPYRILIHSLIDHSEKFLTPLDYKYNDYYGAVRYDGNILFNRNIIADRTIDIMYLEIGNSAIRLVLEDASNPVISEDGESLLFKKKGSNKIYISDVDNISQATMVLDGGNRSISKYAFSPDKSKIAYTLDDSQNNCSDLMVVDIDGNNVKKLLDCSDEKKFITVIKWVDVK